MQNMINPLIFSGFLIGCQISGILSLLHIGHSSLSVNVKHSLQYLTLCLASTIAEDRRSTCSEGMLMI